MSSFAGAGDRGNGRRGDARRRLVEATIQTVQERGRSGATAREIARAAGANLGSIVYYFGSKDALVDQALVAAGERWTDTVRDTGFASGGGTTPGERLASSLGTFLGSLAANRPLALTFLEALASVDRSPTLRSALADRYGELRAAVANGDGCDGESLGVGADAGDAAAGAVIALFDGLLIQWLLEPDRELNAVDLVASLGSLLGTALAEAGGRRVLSSSPVSEARRLAGKVEEEGRERLSNRSSPQEREERPKSPPRAGGRALRRGDVYRLKPPSSAQERRGARYFVLLQPEARDLRTAIVAPVSRRAAAASFRPEVEIGGSEARVLVDRLRAVDRRRFEARAGRLSEAELSAVEEALAALLGLE